jgi:hypothetical protein
MEEWNDWVVRSALSCLKSQIEVIWRNGNGEAREERCAAVLLEEGRAQIRQVDAGAWRQEARSGRKSFLGVNRLRLIANDEWIQMQMMLQQRGEKKGMEWACVYAFLSLFVLQPPSCLA